jgi:serine/threonine-protein kinase
MMGQRLGSYELVRKIAAGGMAEIFLARQWGAAHFFRDVVIKRLFKHLAENERQLRMFQDEARLLASLSHPNIPQVYELGCADGYWYIAMEYVEGWNVADVCRQGAKRGLLMPLQVAIGIVMQVCEALHHAHERTDRARRPLRIVHRDVTPQNIMLTRDGVVKLMDFGVAQTSARRDTEAGAVRGTLSYMAPEQIRAKPLDKRADVFSVGVILYELTTGTRLFRGSDAQVMTQVVEQDVAPPSTRVPNYPPDLEEIVIGALRRDRARRTPSAAHLAWKLEEFAQRHGLLVGPRVVARYISQVIPAEPVLEEELALVAPPAVSVPVSDGPAGSDRLAGTAAAQSFGIDDESYLDDLRLLSLPSEPSLTEGVDEESVPPISVPPDALGPISEEIVDVDLNIADELGEAPIAAVGADESAAEQGEHLFLEGLDDDRERPVVLLGAPKKKSTHPQLGPDPRDYVRELERRLAAEDDEG